MAQLQASQTKPKSKEDVVVIIKEEFKTRMDGVKLFRTYSDEGKMLIQNETGIIYSEAIDVEDAPYTYSESDEEVEENITAEDYEAALAEMGVKV